MRMSDWSSDVCSSDLSVLPSTPVHAHSSGVEWLLAEGLRIQLAKSGHTQYLARHEPHGQTCLCWCRRQAASAMTRSKAFLRGRARGVRTRGNQQRTRRNDRGLMGLKIGRASCRERVCQYV